MTDFPQAPFTWSELADLDISRADLRAALAQRVVRRVVRGVYVRSDLPDSHETRARAVARVISEHQVVCDRTAAWIHGIDVFGYPDQEVLPPIETCAIRGHTRTRLLGVDGRVRDLAPRDVIEVAGVRVTTPLRTALDVGCALGRHRALGALDRFMREHGVTQWEMRHELPRFAGRRGVVQLRTLVPLADPRADSPRESWIRLDIIDAGLPVPELRLWVVIDSRRTYRLDLAYPKHRVVVEYDGEEWHRRTEQQRRRDRDRRAHLARLGWTVIVVDKDGVQSLAWLAELHDALRSPTRRLRWTRTA